MSWPVRCAPHVLESINMLNFEEELKKFKPCLDVENVEESIQNDEMTDLLDLFRQHEMEHAGENPQGEKTKEE